MKRRFKKRERREAIDVDITSLLDILTILLVFLLKSYNASDLTVDLVEKLDMADSKSREMTSFAPIVQVNKNMLVFVNTKEVGRMPASGGMGFLQKALKDERSRLEAENKENNRRLNTSLLNLVFDKELESSHVQRIMHESALAGYSEFKFLVRGVDD